MNTTKAYHTTIRTAAGIPETPAVSVNMCNGNGNYFTVGHVIGNEFRPTNAPQAKHFGPEIAQYIAENNLTSVSQFA